MRRRVSVLTAPVGLIWLLFLVTLALGVLRPALAEGGASEAAEKWPIALDVVLDPARRSLQVEAQLLPAERDFRFALHSSLRISAAEVDGKAVRVESIGGRGDVRGWRIRLPQHGVLNLRYGGTLPALDAQLDHREVLKGMPPMASERGTFLPAGGGVVSAPGRGVRLSCRCACSGRATGGRAGSACFRAAFSRGPYRCTGAGDRCRDRRRGR